MIRKVRGMVWVIACCLALFFAQQSAGQTLAPTDEAKKLSEYMLTTDELFSLSEAQQIDYVENLFELLGEADLHANGEMFEESKSAFWNKKQKDLFELLIEKAEAAGYTKKRSKEMIGSYCIYGGHASQYQEVNGKITCQAMGLGSCQPINGQTAAECNPQLFSIPAPGQADGKLCVPHRPPTNDGVRPGLTHRCAVAFAARLGAGTTNLEAAIKKKLAAMKADKKQRAAWDAWAKEMKLAFDAFENESFGGVGFDKYCAPDASGKLNAKNFNRQMEECSALLRIRNAFTGSGICPKNGKPPLCGPQGGSEAKAKSECGEPESSRLGALACVACGVKKLRGESVSNWVAQIGSAAQIYSGPYNTKDAASREKFQGRVIQMMSAYSYCTDSEYPRESISTNSDRVRNWIDGGEGAYSGNRKDKNAYLETFGYRNDFLFGMNQVSNSFEDSRFDSRSLLQRRKRFFDANHTYTGGSAKTRELASCRRNVETRLKTDPAFALCTPGENRAKASVAKRNRQFCEALAKSCGLSDTASLCNPEPLECPWKRLGKGGDSGSRNKGGNDGGDHTGNDGSGNNGSGNDGKGGESKNGKGGGGAASF